MAMLSVLLLSWLLLGPALAAGVTFFMLAVVGAVPLLAVLGNLVRKPTTCLSDAPERDGRRTGKTVCADSCARLFSSLTRPTSVPMRSCER